MKWLLPLLLVLAAIAWEVRASRGRRHGGGGRGANGRAADGRAAGGGGEADRGPRLLRDTGRHYRQCYGRRGFLKIGGALLLGAGLAYSGADEAVDAGHRDRLRGPATDAAARGLKLFGERPWFLCWLAFGALDAAWRSTPLTRWGRRNFEAMVVGLPLLWTMQYGLGASRPTDSENAAGPRWTRPLRDDNSASGHAFIGAIPWLTLARRAPLAWQRALAGGASTLVGWSRVNDRKHYLSQVWLGWFAAWTATAAVAAVARDERTGAAAGEGTSGVAG